MCGRYTFVPDKNFYGDYEIINTDFELKPNYNVTPGEIMPVVTMNSPKKVQHMKWGLIPFWAKDVRIGFRTINARSEEISLKPSFQKPFKNNRCLIPSTGFYEWDKKGVKKVPYFIHLKNQDMFSFAGLYDVWTDPAGNKITSYTILTVSANNLVGKIHDRMPVILKKEAEEIWANNSKYEPKNLTPLMKPYPDNEIVMYQVGIDVNSPKNNRPELMIKAV